MQPGRRKRRGGPTHRTAVLRAHDDYNGKLQHQTVRAHDAPVCCYISVGAATLGTLLQLLLSAMNDPKTQRSIPGRDVPDL